MTSQILTYVFAGLAVVCAAAGYFLKNRRVSLWVAALAAIAAAASAYFDSFWSMVAFGLVALGGVITATPLVDSGWRVRASIALSTAILAIIALWPTLSEATSGALPCPEYLCAPRAEQPPRVGFKLGRGLDLRGGLRLVYTVDVDQAIRDRRDAIYDNIRAALARAYGFHSGESAPSEKALQELREKVVVSAPRGTATEITLEFKDRADLDSKIDARFRDQFRAEVGDPEIQGSTVRFKIRESMASEIRSRAVAQAKEIILRRVDELGLKEASVSTRDEDIIVEVPGESESTFAEIREIISQTARLEFKLLDDDTDFFAPIAEKVAAEKKAPLDGLEFYRERVPVGQDADGERQVKVITYAYLKIQPGEEAKDALSRFREWAGTLELPPDREIGFSLEYRTVDEVTQKQEADGWRTYLLKQRVEVTGEQVREAQAQPDQPGSGSLGGWHVSLTFTDTGGSIFERITGENVKRRFAIMLDGKVESAPEILTRIAGGQAQITMGSSDPEIQLRDSRKLELVLRSGALPAPISPSNEQRIGPSLGRDAIQLASQGAVGGISIVLLFMIMYYRASGLIATIAVLMNLMLQVAILASFGASLTLPGIAGLALTVGMSVDANVLINERIREELRTGKSARAAVELGYERALSAIVDGQLTTLAAGLVLAQYGTGPIKGFAVTLSIGVLCNLFTGIFVSRVMHEYNVRRLKRGGALSVGSWHVFPVDRVYDFMSGRRWYIGVSLSVSLLGLGGLVYPGPRLGTDFKGGTELEVAFRDDVTPGEIRGAVTKGGFSSPEVIRVQDSEQTRFLVRVEDVSTLGDETKLALERAACFGEELPTAECPADKAASEVKFSPGGDKITVRFKEPVDPAQLDWLRQRVAAVPGVALRQGANTVSLQNPREHRVEVQLESKGDQLMTALRSSLGVEKVPETVQTVEGTATNPLRAEWIGPKAGKQLRNAGMMSVAIALVLMMVYIAFRFDLRFAPGAIVALLHDSFIVLGYLVLANREINLTTVAAILTLIGYSVNDTVVVYDRVRENMGRIRGAPFTYIINLSISETLSRTILSSGTTIFSLLAFFVWGTGVIREFALTLIVGITLGTYSSIYIALPLTEWLDRKVFSRAGARKKQGPGATMRRAEASI